jgi:lipoprotein-releasing system permease protein
VASAADKAGTIALLSASDDDDALTAVSSLNKYPQIFSWLDLIDFNVLIILLLMTVVAGFNMISGLLIMLFRSISTIGTLKAMGMTDRNISSVFLRVASDAVLKGMIAGNLAAIALCLLQKWTHLVHLNPENYFVSFVPIHLNLPLIIVADAISYGLIMLLLLIPTLFISRVDPAQTVRAQ